MTQAMLAVVLYCGLVAWTLRDPEVMSLRSITLVVAAPLAGYLVERALGGGVAGLAAGTGVFGVVFLPVAVHHPLICAYRPADLQLLRTMRRLDGQLVRVGETLRRTRDPDRYRRELEHVLHQIRQVHAPDAEWEALVRETAKDVERALRFASGGGGPAAVEKLLQRRAFLRNAVVEMQKRRHRWI